MSPFLQLAFILVIILVSAKLAGYISIRLGQPSVLGELIVGIILGPTFLNMLELPFITDPHSLEHVITELGEIGVLMLMFIAGLELQLNELRSNTKVAGLAGVMGVVLPLALGWLTGLAFGMTQAQSIFLGLVLGATSVSISAQTLMEMKKLKTRVGLGLLGAAVFDDILVIFLLSLFFALTSGASGLAEVAIVLARMVTFFGLAFAFGLYLLPPLVRLVRNLPISQNVLTLAVVTMLFYGLASEVIGQMAAITGAFLAGLMFARTPEKEIIDPRISALAYGFFVPIFFVSIGLKTNLELHSETLALATTVIFVAVLGKWAGAAIGAKLGGFNWRESLQLGMGMVSRGEVGLIVASAGIKAGLVESTVFASVVGMIIVTTLITPPALRTLFQLPEDWTLRIKPIRNTKKIETSEPDHPDREIS